MNIYMRINRHIRRFGDCVINYDDLWIAITRELRRSNEDRIQYDYYVSPDTIYQLDRDTRHCTHS